MGDIAAILPKLRALIPRLASDADGEVLATVAAIRRQLASKGLDLHDLVAALGAAEPPRHRARRRSEPAPEPAEETPGAMARFCMASRFEWMPHEEKFLAQMSRRGTWASLSEKQAAWLRVLHERAWEEVFA